MRAKRIVEWIGEIAAAIVAAVSLALQRTVSGRAKLLRAAAAFGVLAAMALAVSAAAAPAKRIEPKRSASAEIRRGASRRSKAQTGPLVARETLAAKTSWCGHGPNCRATADSATAFLRWHPAQGSRARRNDHAKLATAARVGSGKGRARAHAAGATVTETTGGEAHTWTNYTNAGGYGGPTIPAYDTIQIACRLQGFRVADGNTWWYLIASSPWNYQYYVSADPFYNNGQTSGSLKGTPFYDPNVPECGSGGGTPETAGGEAHTWSNPANAGGSQGPTIGGGATVGIACRLTGFRVADGNTWWYRIAQSPWNNAYYVSADAFYNNGQTSGSLKGTPFVDPNVPECSPGGGGGGGGGSGETTGGEAHTWTNYTNAGGSQGPTIPSNATVQIECKVTGFRVADGNTWWYRIASSPWNGAYYVSADAFYNNGQTSGSLLGTPFVDQAVPNCSEGARPAGETAGGEAHTWANYSHAGGQQGPTIPGGATVSVSCRVQGFAVANGNTWWYLVASSPWSNVDYVSADAFYNNGQTSGSLKGTPFVDTAVPVCVGNYEAPIGSAVGTYHAVGHTTGCVAGDPVNCASGDFWQSFTDVAIAGRGPGLKLTRTYNSVSPTTAGIFGYGWSSSLDQHLTFSEDGTAVVTLDDGSQFSGPPNGSGGFTLPASADATLQKNEDGSYTLTEHATKALTFSSAGKLLSIADLNGYKTTLSYNGSGQLSSVTDTSGRSLTVAFGSNGFVSSVTDPLGRMTSYGYDGSGNLTSVTDPMSRVTSFTYDESHRLLKMTDPRGGVVTNVYDSQGRVTEQTDPAGLVTTFAYTGDNFSSLGGTTTVTEPHGAITIEQYANGFLSQVTKGSGTSGQGTWSYAYDPSTFGTTSSTDPRGNTTTSVYNATGQLMSTTDPLGHTTSYTYNALQEVLTATTPREETTKRTYDSSGNLTSVTDPAGNVTQYRYGDSSHPGDLTAVVDPEERTEAMTYDTYGDVASRSTSPSSGTHDTTAYSYDTDGEQVCEASPDATAANVVCPAAGSPRVANTATQTFNADGEVTASTDAGGKTTNYSYDADGNQTETIDPRGNHTTTSYDPDNRVTSKTTGAGSSAPATTGHTYDLAPGSGACQALASAIYCNTTTDPDGGVSVDYFDARGNKIATSRPGGQLTRYGFDLDANRTSMTDASSRVTTFGYDAANRLTTITYSDGVTPNVEYSYDADGNRIAMRDGSGTTTYTLDADGRLTATTDGSGATTSYVYDKAGDITKLTYPNGKGVVRAYDGARRLSSVTDWLGHTTTFGYDASGNVTSTSYPNGDTVSSAFSPTSAMTQTGLTGGGKTLLSIGYAHNEDELISAETDKRLTGTSAYTYDARNELLGAGSNAYTYDSAGNLTGVGATHQTYNNEDELTGSIAGTFTTTYAYSPQGERLSAMPSQGFTTSYTYDQAGRLSTVAQYLHGPTIKGVKPSSGPAAGGTRVSIFGENFTGATAVKFGAVTATGLQVTSSKHLSVIAPSGEGVVDIQVTTPSGTSPAVAADQFTYTGTAAVGRIRVKRASEASPPPAISYSYNGDGLRVGRTSGASSEHYTWDTVPSVPEITSDGTNSYLYGPDGQVIEQIDHSETPSYFFHDALGSTRALLASSGAVTGTSTYNPYGSLKKATGTATTPIGYAGGYTDGTGLIYLIHRYYDPTAGQFLTVDPDLATTSAPYSYSGGNPVSVSDPSGLSWYNPFSWSDNTWSTVHTVIGLAAKPIYGFADGAINALGAYASATGTCFAYGWGSNECSDATWHATLNGIGFGISTLLTPYRVVSAVWTTGQYLLSLGGHASAPGSPAGGASRPGSASSGSSGGRPRC